MDRYQEIADGSKLRECAYWYGERTLTGLLAAATWKTPNGFSIEEFTGSRQKGRRVSAGRGDAWISPDGDSWYAIEAKLYPTSALRKDTIVKNVRKRLRATTKQLSSLGHEFRADRGLSLCYIFPDLAMRNKTNHEINAAVKALVNGLAEELGPGHLVATYCPNDAERLPTYCHGKAKTVRRCPALIVVGREFGWKK